MRRPLHERGPASTTLRRARSDRTPPNTRTPALAIWRAAITIPSEIAPATSSTAKVTAIVPIASPSDVVTVAANSKRYGRSRRAPRPSTNWLNLSACRLTPRNLDAVAHLVFASPKFSREPILDATGLRVRERGVARSCR